jgi:hypothetical protein
MSKGYAVEETEEGAMEAIFQLLKTAEVELKTAENRVARLKWELAKVTL